MFRARCSPVHIKGQIGDQGYTGTISQWQVYVKLKQICAATWNIRLWMSQNSCLSSCKRFGKQRTRIRLLNAQRLMCTKFVQKEEVWGEIWTSNLCLQWNKECFIMRHVKDIMREICMILVFLARVIYVNFQEGHEKLHITATFLNVNPNSPKLWPN